MDTRAPSAAPSARVILTISTGGEGLALIAPDDFFGHKPPADEGKGERVGRSQIIVTVRRKSQ